MRKTNLKQNKYELAQPVFFNSKLNPEKTPIDIEKPADQLGSNSANGAPQIKYRTFEEDPNVTDWYYRYRRSGYIRQYILDEDEAFFKEHLEALQKKEKFNFTNLSQETIKIYFHDKEIENTNTISSFSKLPLHKQVLSNLAKMQYDLMTPIQKTVIPYVLDRKDCLGCAQTGSGKTIAFLAPIVSLMLNEGCPKEKINGYGSYPVCLILVPTRELAEQIYKEARKVLHKTGIVVTKVYGGVPNDSQKRELKEGSDIVIGTPGRLIEHIERRFLYLNMIKYLIIDESDRMLDMGFEEQMKEIVFNNQMTPKSQRNNLMFSATIPQNVLSVSEKFMNESYLITSSNKDDIGNANSNVKQIIEYVEDNDKIGKLHEIFQKIQGNAIIFLETKKSVDNLESFLERRNYNVVAIHGDKPQNKRQEAIKYFSSGEVPILIATDVASRGLDFPNVSYVFNYDMPKNIEDYIHRIGRTGRVGNKGTAISFFNSKNSSITRSLIGVLEKMEQEIPEFLYDYYEEKRSNGNFYQRKKYYNNGNNNYYNSRPFNRDNGNGHGNNNSNSYNNNNINRNTNSEQGNNNLQNPNPGQYHFNNYGNYNNNGYNSNYNNYNKRGGYNSRGRGGYRNNNNGRGGYDKGYNNRQNNYYNNNNNSNNNNNTGGSQEFWRG